MAELSQVPGQDPWPVLRELEQRLTELEASLQRMDRGILLRVADPGAGGVQDAPTGMVGRGGDGRWQVEPGTHKWFKVICDGGKEEWSAYGIGEPVQRDEVTDVYWEGDCLYKEFYRITRIDGRERVVEGPCIGCIICATECDVLEAPICDGA